MNNFPFTQAELLTNAILSLLLAGAIILLRKMLVRAILRKDFADNLTRRRLAVSVRNALVFVLVLGLIGIWAKEVQNLALSVVAFAAAMVLATRELIQCATGSFYRTGANAFSVGDRIEVDGRRGEVIDLNLWATTILEIGPAHTAHPYTGRTVVIPNSVLLLQPVVNESFMKPYVIHTISIPMRISEDWQQAEKALLAAAHAECGE
jgi:small-conductance mechanosensitive channel